MLKDRFGTGIMPIDLPKFLKDQEIRRGQWDLLVFGDGSGVAWDAPGGFCAFMIDGRKHLRTHILGAHSSATVNRMELSAYVEAINFHYCHMIEGKIDRPPYRVWIFSDSEYVVKSGSRQNARKANRDLWIVLEWYETRGYQFRWRWVPRNSTPLNAMSDRLAGRVRTSIKEIPMSDDELYALMPAVALPEQPARPELPQCPICEVPLAPGEEVCPQCGTTQ